MALFALAMSSASSPVPSGDPSSTIRTWASGTAPRTASVMGPTLSRSLYVGMMIQMLGLSDGIYFLAAKGLRPRIPPLSPTPLVRRHKRESGHSKAPRGTVRSDCGFACTGRFDHRGQRVRKLLTQRRTALRPLPDLPPGPLHSGFRGARPASDSSTVAGPRAFVQIVGTVSARTAGLVSISLAPPGKTESRPGEPRQEEAYPPVSAAPTAVFVLVHALPTRVVGAVEVRLLHENRCSMIPYRRLRTDRKSTRL